MFAVNGSYWLEFFFPTRCLEVMVGRPSNRFQLDSLPHDSDAAKMRATVLSVEMI